MTSGFFLPFTVNGEYHGIGRMTKGRNDRSVGVYGAVLEVSPACTVTTSRSVQDRYSR